MAEYFFIENGEVRHKLLQEHETLPVGIHFEATNGLIILADEIFEHYHNLLFGEKENGK